MRRNRTTALPQYVTAAHKNQVGPATQDLDCENPDRE
jgi:hypothetical protein